MTPTARTRLAIAVVLLAGPVAPAWPAAPAQQEVFVIDGRGYGHGVGLAQVSAQAMAAAGQGHEQILNHFYPGTGRGSRTASLAVAVWEAEAPTGEVTVSVPRGARVSSDSASADARPGAVLRITADASGYHVREMTAPASGAVIRAALLASPSPSPSPSPDDPLPGLLPSTSPSPSPAPSAGPQPGGSPTAGPTSRPGASPRPAPTPAAATPSSAAAEPLSFDSATPVTVAPPEGGTTSVSATGRVYRGQVTALSRSGFRLVNTVHVEDYLLGLGEVPASWPGAALRAQAVAARTYALRSVGGGRPLGYDICDDTRCQVYLGVTGESPRTAAATRDTRGEVVTYGGGLADTFYSANAGGITATPGEGFGGTTTIPYLPGGLRAPGSTDPYKLSVSPQDVAGRLGYGGRLDTITVTQKGPSGRVTRVRLDGAAGPSELTGIEVQRRLGLRSTLFTVTKTTGLAQALPAPAAAVTQLPPAAAASVLAVPSPSPSADPGRAAAIREPALPSWAVTVAAAFIVLLLFGVVLLRRAQLAARLPAGAGPSTAEWPHSE